MLVVTGGAGFIGSHLTDKLETIDEVLVIDDHSFGERIAKNERQCSILDADALSAALDADAVFHLAAMADVRENEQNPVLARRINVQGTENVLEACRKNEVKRFVFASSSAVYGETSESAGEDAPFRPQSVYGACKADAEKLAARYAQDYGLKVTVLRFANVYGPRSRRGVMFDFYKKLKTEPVRLEILGDGRQTKSYVFISDAIDAVMAAYCKQSEKMAAFNVGAFLPVSVNEIAKKVCFAMGFEPRINYTGGRVGWKGDVPTTLLDCTRLAKLGWTPKIGLEKGVNDYVHWLEQGGNRG